MHAHVSVLRRVSRGISWRSVRVRTRELFYIKYMSSVMPQESLDIYTQTACSRKVQTRWSLFHLDLVAMSAELDVEKFAGSDLSSATTGSTLTPSYVDGSECRSSVTTSAVAREGK